MWDNFTKTPPTRPHRSRGPLWSLCFPPSVPSTAAAPRRHRQDGSAAICPHLSASSPRPQNPWPTSLPHAHGSLAGEGTDVHPELPTVQDGHGGQDSLQKLEESRTQPTVVARLHPRDPRHLHQWHAGAVRLCVDPPPLRPHVVSG